MKDRSSVVNCRGCGGTGQQGHYGPFTHPHDCGVCGGSGRVRISPEDCWCSRCGGTGQEEAGSPGFKCQNAVISAGAEASCRCN